jgi:hypothetical protein
MIVIPIEEATVLHGEINGEVEKSLRVIFKALAENPDERDQNRETRDRKGWFRSSLSVIRAFAEEFCDIPPFCDRKGLKRERR